MVYGYEDPVAMPTMDVYDTSLARMYIAGLKDLYDKALAKTEDYMKLYRDFYSPVDGATDAYQAETTGRIQSLLAAAAENNIDLFKSPLGRAMISKVINETNIAKLKLLEQQRDNYKIYQASLADAIAKGRVTEEQERFMRGDYYNNFNALNENGEVNTWNRLSPTNVDSLHNLTATEYEKLSATKYRGNRGLYRIYGQSDEDRRLAEDASMKILLSNEAGRWYRHIAERNLGMIPGTPGYNQAAVDAELRRMINAENPLKSSEVVDQVALQQMLMLENEQQKALDGANALEIAGARAATKKGKNGSGKETGDKNVPFTVRSNADSNAKYKDLNYGNLSRTANKISIAYTKLAQTLGKKSLTYGNGIYTADNSLKIANWFSNHANISDPKVKKAWIDKGYLDKDGNYTAKLDRHVRLVNAMEGSKFVADKTGNFRMVRDASYNAGMYNGYTNGVPTGLGHTLAQAFTGDTAQAENDKDIDKKSYQFNFARPQWQLSANRHSRVAGFSNINKQSLAFERYLKSNRILGTVRNTSRLTSYGAIPNAKGSYDMDVSGLVTVRYNELEGFFKSIGMYSEEAKAEWLASRGCTLKATNGKTITTISDRTSGDVVDNATVPKKATHGTNKKIEEPIEYVLIPVTTTLTNNGYGFSDLDSAVDKVQYGLAKTYDLATDRQSKSLTSANKV